MENLVNNKIIRRYGITKDESYHKVAEDFYKAFNGFDGVTIEQNETTETENAATVIYLDENKRQFLKIVYDQNSGFRMSFHCGDDPEKNMIYLDISDKGEYVPYNIVRTAYGVAFSDFPYTRNATDAVSDGNLQNYFAKMEDENGKKINCFFHVSATKDAAGSHYVIISSEQHDASEKLSVGTQYIGSAANHTVLFNAVSYTLPLKAEHFYKKIQSEADKFGKIKINGKTFICGSHYCLECEEG